MKCTVCGKSITKLVYMDSSGVRICSDDCLERYADQQEAKRKESQKGKGGKR